MRMQGTLAWAPDAEPVINYVDFTARVGELIVVVGATGSGKSTFLSALLGLTHRTEELKSEVRGKVAFVSQQAYIFGGASPLCFLGLCAPHAWHDQSNGGIGAATRISALYMLASCCILNLLLEFTQACAGTVQDNILFDMILVARSIRAGAARRPPTSRP